MAASAKLRHLPTRFATGAVIFNSGLGKRNADAGTAAMLHGMAAGTYPFLKKIPPDRFTRLLSTAEIALGAALLIPMVPTALVGVGLTAFSAGLFGLYLRTPGMRQEGSLRPTPQGTVLVKDIWMLAIGMSYLVDAVNDRRTTDR
jgi:uncharacterized membrane protein YkgB